MKEIAEKEAVRTQLKSDQKPAVEKVEAKFSRWKNFNDDVTVILLLGYFFCAFGFI